MGLQKFLPTSLLNFAPFSSIRSSGFGASRWLVDQRRHLSLSLSQKEYIIQRDLTKK